MGRVLVALLALLLLSGCATQTVATEDNGPSGRREFKLPLPVWPSSPSCAEPAK